MLLQTTSDLIIATHGLRLNGTEQVELAELQNGLVLVIASQALAMYRSKDAVGDLLGNGLLASVDLPCSLVLEQGHFIKEHRAGYVGLYGDFVLLITFNDVQLFACKQDALNNRNELARLSLSV